MDEAGVRGQMCRDMMHDSFLKYNACLLSLGCFFLKRATMMHLLHSQLHNRFETGKFGPQPYST